MTQTLENLKQLLWLAPLLLFNWILWPKYMFELRKVQMCCLMALKIDAKFKGKMTCLSQMTWGIWQICIGWNKWIANLKLVSAIFYQIFIPNQSIALQKLWRMLFISSQKLFSFSRYSIFCISIFPSFSPCQPLL